MPAIRVGDAPFGEALLAELGQSVTLPDSSVIRIVIDVGVMVEQDEFQHTRTLRHPIRVPIRLKGTLEPRTEIHLGGTEAYHVVELWDDPVDNLTHGYITKQ